MLACHFLSYVPALTYSRMQEQSSIRLFALGLLAGSASLPAAFTYCRQTAAVWQLQHRLQSTFLKGRLMISSSDCRIRVFQITSQAQVGIWALSLHTFRCGACFQCAYCNTLGCRLHVDVSHNGPCYFIHQTPAMSSVPYWQCAMSSVVLAKQNNMP